MQAVAQHPSGQSWIDRDSVAYHAMARPDHLACLDLASGERFSYRTLDQHIARCAGWLACRLGDPRGLRIAVLARNGVEQVILGFAAERVGAIFAPLNWRLSAPELRVLLQDSAPAMFVWGAEFDALAHQAAEGLGLCNFVRIAPDTGEFRAALNENGPAVARPSPPDSPSILLYTSGTTGRPKGVVFTRRNCFFAALNFTACGEISPQAVVLCDAPMFHTIGLIALTRTTLQCGGTLVISDRFTPGRTLQRLSDPGLGITHYFGVPQMAQSLLDEPGFAAADLSRLKAFVVGGAPLARSIVERFAARGVPVANGYGMSETGTVLGMPLDIDVVRQRPESAGVPAPVMDIRIVRADGAEAAPGEVGELWLRGPAVTPGYWNQPEATAAAFTDGWLRTGDAGFRDEDGFHQLIDRWKDMYISGGENVYPAEVEAALLALPGVAEAAVVGAPDARWGEVGCAFLVAAPEADLTIETVLAHCATRLAGYKRPRRVEFVPDLPRTASGKLRKDILRRRLGQA